MSTLGSTKLFFLLVLLLPCTVSAQAVPWLDEPAEALGTQPDLVRNETSPPAFKSMAPQAVNAANPSAVAIPAGTRVLMVLKSPLHTTSGTAGSGIYLETLYPVIANNRVAIPAHTQVQGVIEADQRPGHVNRVSEFRFRFTTLIFPNNYVV